MVAFLHSYDLSPLDRVRDGVCTLEMDSGIYQDPTHLLFLLRATRAHICEHPMLFHSNVLLSGSIESPPAICGICVYRYFVCTIACMFEQRLFWILFSSVYASSFHLKTISACCFFYTASNMWWSPLTKITVTSEKKNKFLPIYFYSFWNVRR